MYDFVVRGLRLQVLQMQLSLLVLDVQAFNVILFEKRMKSERKRPGWLFLFFLYENYELISANS